MLGMHSAWWIQEKVTKFRVKSLKEEDHSECIGVNGGIILKWILWKECLRLLIGLVCVGIRRGDGRL
jgi:hypothetical protein